MKKIALIVSLATVGLLASEGKALLEKNCASCHMLSTPEASMIPTLKAPAMDAVGFHLKLVKKETKAQEQFIVDYALNPLVSKSVCESNKVQKFGVMPSLKGKVSKEDLEKIAAYVVENFPSEKFTKMIKEIHTNDTLNALKSSPFLMNSDGLPHLTKLLLKNWDKADLALSPEQKEKLLVVRKETLTTVKKVKQQIVSLEEKVLETMVDGDDYKALGSTVDEIAKLKAMATKAHLKCIAETLEILNDEQVAYLLPFGDY